MNLISSYCDNIVNFSRASSQTILLGLIVKVDAQVGLTQPMVELNPIIIFNLSGPNDSSEQLLVQPQAHPVPIDQ